MDSDENSENELVIIDGSKGEGGGQIIRNSIVYASLFKLRLRIHSIRAKRKKPGLRAQHVKGLELAAAICGGHLTDAKVASCTMEFHPDETTSKISHKDSSICCDIGTAGSICLLLQVALPCLIYSSQQVHSLELRGGTNADLAPQIDYFQEVLLPMLTRLCFPIVTSTDSTSIQIPSILNTDIIARGYYPVGNGVVKCSLRSDLRNFQGPINPITLMDRGKVTSIHIKSFYAGKLPEFVAKKMAKSALKLIKQFSHSDLDGVEPTVEITKHDPAVGSACGIMIIANTSTNCIFGASSLQKRNEKAEKVGTRAAQELLDNLRSGGCVDEWLQDQLIIFMALADGMSQIRTGCLTQHTQTAIDIAIELTGAQFDVHEVDPSNEDKNIIFSDEYGKQGCVHGQHIISCIGMGFLPDAQKRL